MVSPNRKSEPNLDTMYTVACQGLEAEEEYDEEDPPADFQTIGVHDEDRPVYVPAKRSRVGKGKGKAVATSDDVDEDSDDEGM